MISLLFVGGVFLLLLRPGNFRSDARRDFPLGAGYLRRPRHIGRLCSGCWRQLDALESGSEDLLRGSSQSWSPFSPHYRGKTLLGPLPDASRIVRFAILAGGDRRWSPSRSSAGHRHLSSSRAVLPPASSSFLTRCAGQGSSSRNSQRDLCGHEGPLPLPLPGSLLPAPLPPAPAAEENFRLGLSVGLCQETPSLDGQLGKMQG